MDIAAVARDAADGLAAVLRERNVSIQVEGAGPTTAVVDRGAALTQALRNLLTNAVNLPGGTVTDFARGGRRAGGGTHPGQRGPGIADEDRPYVFERFYRADRSRSRSRGAASA